MDEHKWLALRFEENRTHLRAVAYRMLGSLSEADDAVQEAWLRLSGSDAGGIDNLPGWLTTVVPRICLDILRSRSSRREENLPDSTASPSDRGGHGLEGAALQPRVGQVDGEKVDRAAQQGEGEQDEEAVQLLAAAHDMDRAEQRAGSNLER